MWHNTNIIGFVHPDRTDTDPDSLLLHPAVIAQSCSLKRCRKQCVCRETPEHPHIYSSDRNTHLPEPACHSICIRRQRYCYALDQRQKHQFPYYRSNMHRFSQEQNLYCWQRSKRQSSRARSLQIHRRNDEELLRDFRSALDSTLLQTIIPYSDTVRESQKAGLPLEAYFTEKKVPRSGSSWKIVNAYENLTGEILRRSEV